MSNQEGMVLFLNNGLVFKLLLQNNNTFLRTISATILYVRHILGTKFSSVQGLCFIIFNLVNVSLNTNYKGYKLP